MNNNNHHWKRLFFSSSSSSSSLGPLFTNDDVSSLYCHREHRPCVKWVEKYFKDCLCNLSDEFSFGFGIVSLVAWGVAEIPQIVTNFRSKSGHGVSILFLLTWFVGDIFNLVGCVLEPATLPTQLYTALLYTVSTVVLVLQSIYYDYFCRWWWRNRSIESEDDENQEETGSPRKHNHKQAGNKGGGGEHGGEGAGIPIPGGGGYFYTSARSLAGSDTPPFRRSSSSYLRKARSGPPAGMIGVLIHEDDDKHSEEDNHHNGTAAVSRTTQPRPIPRAVARGAVMAFAAATVNLPIQTHALVEAAGVGYVGFTGRRLLQEREFEHHSAVGQWLGWLMAVIYMGGRIPQIILNIKRGNVEGLNPLMFIFALLANLAYVASILVRSTEWGKIKANMPWLLDAVVCVALDLFIILQYVYYKHRYRKNNNNNHDHHITEEYDEKKAPLLLPHYGNKS